MSGRRNTGGASAPSGAKPASLDSTSSATADAQGRQPAFAEMEQAMTGLPEPSHKKVEPLKLRRDFAAKCRTSTDADPLHGGVTDDPVILASGNADPLHGGVTDDPVILASGNNANCAVLEEIKAINRRLIDAEITIADDSGTNRTTSSCDGTSIKLSYTAVAVSPDLRSLSEMGVVTPAKLYVPSDYPRSSPTLIIDKGDDQLRKNSSTISDSAHMKFSIALSDLPEPRLIKDIVSAWQTCVRSAVIEFVQPYGGGTFSSRFGGWKGASTD